MASFKLKILDNCSISLNTPIRKWKSCKNAAIRYAQLHQKGNPAKVQEFPPIHFDLEQNGLK